MPIHMDMMTITMMPTPSMLMSMHQQVLHQLINQQRRKMNSQNQRRRRLRSQQERTWLTTHMETTILSIIMAAQAASCNEHIIKMGI